MTRKFKTLSDHIKLARLAHDGDTDKAGLDYFEHPNRVMQAVQARGGLPFVQSAAILHDVTEDTAFSVNVLKEIGVPEPVLEIIRLVDRAYSSNVFHSMNFASDVAHKHNAKGKKWYVALGPFAEDFFYYDNIRKNAGARMVKECDMDDNTLEYRLSYLSWEKQDELRFKYWRARSVTSGNWDLDTFNNIALTREWFNNTSFYKPDLTD